MEPYVFPSLLVRESTPCVPFGRAPFEKKGGAGLLRLGWNLDTRVIRKKTFRLYR